MKPLLLLLLLPLLSLRAEEVVILDAETAPHLRFETAEAEEGSFETTLFALGQLEVIPGKVGIVSSRISGRITTMNAQIGTSVKAGEPVLEIESRQPGSPPPTVALTALLSGVITGGPARLGEPVEPDRSLLEITDLSELDAVARLPAGAASQLAPGAKARVRVALSTGEPIEAELIRFGLQGDAKSGTIEAHFRVKNDDLRLRPGLRCEFSVITSSRDGVLRIPKTALQGDRLAPYVFVKHFDLPNAYTKAKVVTGEENDRWVEIKEGIFEGDEVVTQGGYLLAQPGGSSGISLKEALDAAHGHEHAEDGSELTPEKRAELERAKAAETGSPLAETPPASPFWKWSSLALLLLWLATLAGRFLPQRS